MRASGRNFPRVCVERAIPPLLALQVQQAELPIRHLALGGPLNRLARRIVYSRNESPPAVLVRAMGVLDEAAPWLGVLGQNVHDPSLKPVCVRECFA